MHKWYQSEWYSTKLQFLWEGSYGELHAAIFKLTSVACTQIFFNICWSKQRLDKLLEEIALLVTRLMRETVIFSLNFYSSTIKVFEAVVDQVHLGAFMLYLPPRVCFMQFWFILRYWKAQNSKQIFRFKFNSWRFGTCICTLLRLYFAMSKVSTSFWIILVTKLTN